MGSKDPEQFAALLAGAAEAVLELSQLGQTSEQLMELAFNKLQLTERETPLQQQAPRTLRRPYRERAKHYQTTPS